MLLIQQYNAARQAGSGDIEAASEELSELSGIYLDVDSRNGLKEVDELCRRLISAGKYDEAIDLATMADESLVPDDKSKNSYFCQMSCEKLPNRRATRDLPKKPLHYMRRNRQIACATASLLQPENF